MTTAVATIQRPIIDSEETTLLRRCCQGEKAAFEKIVQRYRDRAFRVAVGLVGSRADARDLTQEAFIRAFVKIHRFDPDRPFFPWFYRILKNLCLTFLARRKRRAEVSTEPRDQDSQPLILVSDDMGPEAKAILAERSALVWQAIHRLSDKDREIITLRHFVDLSYAEIADQLGIPRGTVMSRLFYARRALRDLLEDVLGGER